MNDRRDSKNFQTANYSVEDLSVKHGWSASMVRLALGILFGQGRVTVDVGKDDGPRQNIAWRATTAEETAKM